MSLSIWKKYWSSEPQWQVETDPATGKRTVVDWNEAMVKVAVAAGGTATHEHWLAQSALVNEHLAWLESKDSDKPWIVRADNGRILRWNKAATEAAAAELKVSIPDTAGEQRVLIARQEERVGGLAGDKPFMQANHYGFDGDGAVKLELDWNRAFINHLREFGFEGDEDLDVVKSYLASLTSKPPQEQLIESFDEMRQWVDREGDGEALITALEGKLKEVKRARRKR